MTATATINQTSHTDDARTGDTGVGALVESMPAGSRLSAVLESVDVASLGDYECLQVLLAQQRQVNHEMGQLLEVTADISRRLEALVGQWRYSPLDLAAAEVQATLVLTTSSARQLCGLASDAFVRLPAIGAAMRDGLLDAARATVFSQWTNTLSQDHARAVVEKLLPQATSLTTTQLSKRIAELAIALDPSWTRRRYQQALRRRRVVGSSNPEGTANVSGMDLPIDQAAAAYERLDRLARAAKTAGHTDTLDSLRADIFLALLNGTYSGLTDQQVVSKLLATATTATTATASAEGAEGSAASTGERGEDSTAGQGTDDDPHAATTAGAAAADNATAGNDSGNTGKGSGSTGKGSGSGGGNAGKGSGSTGKGSGSAGSGSRGGGYPRRYGPSAGLRVMMRLVTLIGLDRRPGRLIGWGPLHAELARAMATSPRAIWSYVLVDDAGVPLSSDIIRRRPTTPDSPPPAAGAGGSAPLRVWIQFTQAALDTLTQQPPPGWAKVLAEINLSLQKAATANWKAEAKAKAKAKAKANGAAQDREPRLPDTELRLWIQLRDQTCTFRGCEVPGNRCDVDHTKPHAEGGLTQDHNLSTACRRHHSLRHKGGWDVKQPMPGRVIWISPLGHHHSRLPPSNLDDLPEPMPNADERRA